MLRKVACREADGDEPCKDAALKALTRRHGIRLPASAPRAVPTAQPGSANAIAPYIYQGFKQPGLAIVIPNSSSVISNAMRSLWKNGISGSILWLMAQLISKYLAFAISVTIAISIYAAPAAIIVKPAYSPADALQSALVIIP